MGWDGGICLSDQRVLAEREGGDDSGRVQGLRRRLGGEGERGGEGEGGEWSHRVRRRMASQPSWWVERGGLGVGDGSGMVSIGKRGEGGGGRVEKGREWTEEDCPRNPLVRAPRRLARVTYAQSRAPSTLPTTLDPHPARLPLHLEAQQRILPWHVQALVCWEAWVEAWSCIGDSE